MAFPSLHLASIDTSKNRTVSLRWLGIFKSVYTDGHVKKQELLMFIGGLTTVLGHYAHSIGVPVIVPLTDASRIAAGPAGDITAAERAAVPHTGVVTALSPNFMFSRASGRPWNLKKKSLCLGKNNLVKYQEHK